MICELKSEITDPAAVRVDQIQDGFDRRCFSGPVSTYKAGDSPSLFVNPQMPEKSSVYQVIAFSKSRMRA
jgi:hypothetical protein